MRRVDVERVVLEEALDDLLAPELAGDEEGAARRVAVDGPRGGALEEERVDELGLVSDDGVDQ